MLVLYGLRLMAHSFALLLLCVFGWVGDVAVGNWYKFKPTVKLIPEVHLVGVCKFTCTTCKEYQTN